MALGPLEIMNLIAGLVLLSGSLRVIPAMGKYLEKTAKWLGSFQTIIGIVTLIVAVLWFRFLQGLIGIVAGLVLIVGILPAIPAVGKSLEKVSKWLGSFQTIIGIIALLLSILGILGVV